VVGTRRSWLACLGCLLVVEIAGGEVFLRCDSTQDMVGNGSMVTIECTILSTETIDVRAVQVDLPCSLRAEPGTTGSAVKRSMFVDLNHQNPPSLFGAMGLGAVFQAECRAGQTPGIGGEFFTTLGANDLRYVATYVYEVQGVTACGGEFHIDFEGNRIPPTISDQTRVVVPFGPRPGQAVVPFTPLTGRVPVTAAADGTPCDDGLFCTAEDACQRGVCEGHGTACLGQACDEELDRCVPSECPGHGISQATPASGTIDARSPYEPDDDSSAARKGIGGDGEPINLSVGVSDAPTDCFILCETMEDVLLGANEPMNVTEKADGDYEITLLHPVAPGGVTTLSYGHAFVAYLAHPGNVNGDDMADVDDFHSLMAYLNGEEEVPFGLLSVDLDHSGQATPADLVRIVDLFNGAELYDEWLNTPLPANAKICP